MNSRILINGKEVSNPVVKGVISVIVFLLLLLLLVLLIPLIGIGIGIGLGAGLIGLTTLAIRYRLARRRLSKLREVPEESTFLSLPSASEEEKEI